MKNEEEVRALYRQYVARYAARVNSHGEEDKTANQFLGVAFGYGRTLDRTMNQIREDLTYAKDHIHGRMKEAKVGRRL